MKMEVIADTRSSGYYDGMYDFEKPDNCWRRANTVSAGMFRKVILYLMVWKERYFNENR
jgi:hypothetical protein